MNFGINSSGSVLSVRQLNFYVRSQLESDPKLVSCAVCGEISNFKRHFSSGHCYFSLKDDSAAVKCVMFKTAAERVAFDIKDGIKVVCRGRVSLYEKDGTYQFYADYIEPDGIGAKALALEQLKQKLAKEGLFDITTKRKLPQFPKKIAVVTSGSGAAFHDIVNVISRRYPVCEIIAANASVQGKNAVKELSQMLSKIYIIDDIDTVIIGRGGGSNEDLDAFNSELLARTVYDSPFPVISAVGHETDITICDLVADLRAPTPSAAAELAVPDLQSLQNRISILQKRIFSLLYAKTELLETKLNSLKNLSFLKHPELFTDSKTLILDKLQENIKNYYTAIISNKEKAFSELDLKTDAMSPLKCLSRGYSVVYSNKKILKSSSDISIGDTVDVYMNDGNLICEVKEKL